MEKGKVSFGKEHAKLETRGRGRRRNCNRSLSFQTLFGVDFLNKLVKGEGQGRNKKGKELTQG
ncbi:hypothetical protein V6Z12_A13G066900 [Gossypium hirsutum]